MGLLSFIFGAEKSVMYLAIVLVVVAVLIAAAVVGVIKFLLSFAAAVGAAYLLKKSGADDLIVAGVLVIGIAAGFLFQANVLSIGVVP